MNSVIGDIAKGIVKGGALLNPGNSLFFPSSMNFDLRDYESWTEDNWQTTGRLFSGLSGLSPRTFLTAKILTIVWL